MYCIAEGVCIRKDDVELDRINYHQIKPEFVESCFAVEGEYILPLPYRRIAVNMFADKCFRPSKEQNEEEFVMLGTDHSNNTFENDSDPIELGENERILGVVCNPNCN